LQLHDVNIGLEKIFFLQISLWVFKCEFVSCLYWHGQMEAIETFEVSHHLCQLLYF